MKKMFVKLVIFNLWHLIGVFGDDKVKLVKEGGSVTLNSGLTEMIDHDLILWWFRNENNLIAEVNLTANDIFVYDDVLDGRFRNRLKVDNKTGSLIITDTTTEHSGVYKLLIVGAKWSPDSFSVSVCADLPIPVISRNSSQCSSPSSSFQYCSVVCSVVNVNRATLSWYNESSLLSSISVSDFSMNLSLPLEVEYQENNTYSCVINNPFDNHTQQLNIHQLCHTCSDSVHCCGSTEAAIRLVLSALVGVATVLILVYDIRSRAAQQDRAHIHTSET